MNSSSITAIIVNYRTPQLAMQAVSSLMEQRVEGCRLNAVLVDGGSNDGSQKELQSFCDRHPSGAVLFRALGLNGGFGWANNQVLLRILQEDEPPEFVYLLNPDARAAPDALRPLYELLRCTPDAAAAGSLLLDAGGVPSGSAFAFPTLRSEFARGANIARLGRWLGVGTGLINSASPARCDWVTGASVLFRTAALRQTGPFDDGFFLYYEEAELMSRLTRAGWSIWHQPASRVFHVGGAATGLDADLVGAKIARRPWYWYQSKRRFFMLSRGRLVACLAALAWLAGYMLRYAVRGLRRAAVPRDVVQEFEDTARLCLSGARDLPPSIPTEPWQIGRPPAWMSMGGS